MWSSISRLFVVFVGTESGEEMMGVVSKKHPFIVYFHLGKIVASLSCFQTSCTMDQNLARLQNPHRFLRENRFLEGEDPSKGLFYDVWIVWNKSRLNLLLLLSVVASRRMLQLARHTSEETRSNFGPISGFGNPKHQSSNSCSNRDQERDGSGNLFVPKLDPPSGFSDAFELSEAECDLDRGHTSQRNVRDFVIAV